ncbi:unnamed protein product [Clavelina lepadiformis]|uniref:Mutator-like transposase domain-containing protein n=1 Tax=Clavelina lepadiformis TaxID=159417 RepID=A0ABP0GDH9_CLALP
MPFRKHPKRHRFSKGHRFYERKESVPRSSAESKLKWKRPSDSEMISLKHPNTGDILGHHLLRPLVKEESLIEQLADANEGTESFVGNRIMSCARLEEILSDICNGHNCQSPFCEAKFKGNWEEIRGCGSIVKFKCLCCDFVSQSFATFDKVSGQENRSMWQSNSKVNLQLACGIMLSGLSQRSAQAFLSCLDLPSPNLKRLSRYCKKTSDLVSKCNEDDMRDRRISLKERNLRVGLPSKAKVSVEADSRFNVGLAAAPKQPTQPATQVVSVMAENVTPKKSIIAIGMKTKERAGRKSTDVRSNDQFPIGVPPGNMERTLGEQLAKDLQRDAIDVDVLTTDNDSKFLEGFSKQMENSQKEQVTRQVCCVHTFRSLGRRMKQLKLGTLFPARDTNRTVAARSQKKFALECQSRLFAEYKVCILKYGNNIDEMAAKLLGAADAMLGCLQGDHSDCKRLSFVCRGREKPVTWCVLVHGAD